MEEKIELTEQENNSGRVVSYVDAGVHSKDNREKLYSIIDGLNGIARKWEDMMNYDIVACIGAISYRLENLADKIDKELKESQHSI